VKKEGVTVVGGRKRTACTLQNKDGGLGWVRVGGLAGSQPVRQKKRGYLRFLNSFVPSLSVTY
jgi:hypothetical protein